MPGLEAVLAAAPVWPHLSPVACSDPSAAPRLRACSRGAAAAALLPVQTAGVLAGAEAALRRFLCAPGDAAGRRLVGKAVREGLLPWCHGCCYRLAARVAHWVSLARLVRWELAEAAGGWALLMHLVRTGAAEHLRRWGEEGDVDLWVDTPAGLAEVVAELAARWRVGPISATGWAGGGSATALDPAASPDELLRRLRAAAVEGGAALYGDCAAMVQLEHPRHGRFQVILPRGGRRGPLGAAEHFDLAVCQATARWEGEALRVRHHCPAALAAPGVLTVASGPPAGAALLPWLRRYCRRLNKYRRRGFGAVAVRAARPADWAAVFAPAGMRLTGQDDLRLGLELVRAHLERVGR